MTQVIAICITVIIIAKMVVDYLSKYQNQKDDNIKELKITIEAHKKWFESEIANRDVEIKNINNSISVLKTSMKMYQK